MKKEIQILENGSGNYDLAWVTFCCGIIFIIIIIVVYKYNQKRKLIYRDHDLENPEEQPINNGAIAITKYHCVSENEESEDEELSNSQSVTEYHCNFKKNSLLSDDNNENNEDEIENDDDNDDDVDEDEKLLNEIEEYQNTNWAN